MTNRREFIQLAGLGVLATSVPDFLKLPEVTAKHHLGVQLYTFREAIAKDFKGSLKLIADLGIKNVETAFWPEHISVQTAADALKENHLKVSSCHVDIPIKNNIAKLVKDARAYDCDTLIWHGWPEDKRYSSLEGTKELIKIYEESNKLAQDNGLHFGLHNHWWEYRNKVGGKLVYEILHEELNDQIFFETDIYWVKVAGQDPVSILKKLNKRIRYIHIKDGPAVYSDKLFQDNPDPMSPVGQGSLDIPAIINACSDKVQWMVMELDKSVISPFEAIKQSKDYLVKFKSISVT
jgi:sugar phosphate isomerase/epimerase